MIYPRLIAWDYVLTDLILWISCRDVDKVLQQNEGRIVSHLTPSSQNSTLTVGEL
jgi:hypothetical protein